MSFAHPQVLWLLLAVAGLAVFVRGDEQRRFRTLAAFAGPKMLARLSAEHSSTRARAKAWLTLGALACLVVALADPRWGSRLVTVQRQGIDVVLAVDCSASMDAPDVKPTRLGVAKRELGTLIEQLDGNRLAVVGFAGSAFPFCPLTLDASATTLFLDQLDTHALPVPGTSLGDAIHTSMKCFPAGDSNKKVIVLLTDGEDHHSAPLDAAREAARAGIVIDTVGIGNPNGAPIPEAQESGQTDYLRDADGNVVMSRLDESGLQQIASLTGGHYVHVDGTRADALGPIVSGISGSQKHNLEETVERRQVQRFQLLLALAILMLASERLVTTRRRGFSARSTGSPLAREKA